MSDEVSRIKKKRSANEDAKESEKWSEEHHRSFVEAIYEAGVSQSSPSVILENMSNRPASLTSERVKSHLQKYRKNKQKSKEDFMQDYDSFMRKAMTVGGAGGGASHVIMPPAAMIEMMGGGKPSGGDIAAFLSYSVMTEGDIKNTSGKSITSSIGIAKESQDYLKNFAGTHVPFPQLTEEEKRSPLGISMVYVMGLFSSLSQHMMHERRKRFKPKSDEREIPLVPGNANAATSNSMNAPMNSSSSSATSNLNKAQGGEMFAPGQKQDSHWSDSVSWGNPALKQVHLMQQQMPQDGGSRPLAGADAGLTLTQPRPAVTGFFHPILAKADIADTKNVATGSTNWNTNLLQPSGVAVFEAPPQAQTNKGSQGRLPPSQNRGAPSGSGPYAQV